jgi:hypothetical protein
LGTRPRGDVAINLLLRRPVRPVLNFPAPRKLVATPPGPTI